MLRCAQYDKTVASCCAQHDNAALFWIEASKHPWLEMLRCAQHDCVVLLEELRGINLALSG